MTRIIRPGDVPSPRRQRSNPNTARILTARVLQAQEEARRIVVHAEDNASNILSQAQAEALELQKRASERSNQECAAQLLNAARACQKNLDENRTSLTRLAVHIAEKLLGEELRLSPQAVTHIVETCIARASSAKRIELRIHPADAPLLEVSFDELGQKYAAQAITLTLDDRVEPGGCILDTDIGQFDGQIASQLQTILEVLSHEP